MWSLVLFAALFAEAETTPAPAPALPRDPLQRPEVIWGVVGLAGALLAGAAVIYAVDKWRKRAAAEATAADGAGSLTSFRAMYENGEITEAEYAELRRRVAEKMKKPSPGGERDLPSVKPGFTAAPFTTPTQSGASPAADRPAPPGGAPEPPPPPSTA